MDEGEDGHPTTHAQQPGVNEARLALDIQQQAEPPGGVGVGGSGYGAGVHGMAWSESD